MGFMTKISKRLILAGVVAGLLGAFVTPALADMETLLDKLHEKGVLSDDDYQQMRTEARAVGERARASRVRREQVLELGVEGRVDHRRTERGVELVEGDDERLRHEPATEAAEVTPRVRQGDADTAAAARQLRRGHGDAFRVLSRGRS